MSCVTVAELPTLVLRVFNLQENELWEKKHTLETKYEGPFPAERRRYQIVHKPCLMQNKFLVREKYFGELQPVPREPKMDVNLNYDAYFSI